MVEKGTVGCVFWLCNDVFSWEHVKCVYFDNFVEKLLKQYLELKKSLLHQMTGIGIVIQFVQ